MGLGGRPPQPDFIYTHTDFMLRMLRIVFVCGLSCSLICAGGLNFHTPRTLSLGNVSAEAFGDFRNTGRQDLMVVSFEVGLQLYPNEGHGQFGSPATILADLTGFTSQVAAADFNGDGKLDVALLTNGELNAGSVTILLGNGNGTFQSPIVYSTGSLTGGAVLLAAAFLPYALITISPTTSMCIWGTATALSRHLLPLRPAHPPSPRAT